MVEHRIGEGGQPLGHVVIGVADRVVGTVGARQDDRSGRIGTRIGYGCEQQMMNRRVREQHADERVTGRHCGIDGSVGSASQQHHRPSRAAQKCGLGVVDLGVRTRGVKPVDHDDEGLATARLSLPQLRDGCGVVGRTCEVIAADALDGDDGAGGKCLLRRHQCRVDLGDPDSAAGEPQRRPAMRTRDGLCVEPAIGGVLVFHGAAVAHGEVGHGGRGPVIGESADDRETRTAVGARHEGVPVAPVQRVEELSDAVFADRDVRRNGGRCRVDGLAADYVKALVSRRLCGDVGPGNVADHRQRRSFGSEAVAEPTDRSWRTFDFDEDGG